MQGTLVSGERAAAGFVAAVEALLAEAVGFRPFHGTLNVASDADLDGLPLLVLDDDLGDDRCEGVNLRPCTVGGVRCAVIRPLVPDYPASTVELLAPIRLRTLFGLDDGATVSIDPPDDRLHPDGPVADPTALDRFDAAVFDLDGTLVDLAVDWPAVHEEIEARFDAFLDRPLSAYGRNGLFDAARANGAYDELAALLEGRERAGAADASGLPAIELLASLACPVGVCTANATSAAEVSLDRFGVRDAVDAIVARETTRAGKPDPAPLLACVDRLGVEPGNVVFVGDEPTDAEAAAGAGTSFLHVDQLWPGN